MIALKCGSRDLNPLEYEISTSGGVVRGRFVVRAVPMLTVHDKLAVSFDLGSIECFCEMAIRTVFMSAGSATIVAEAPSADVVGRLRPGS